MTNMYNVTLFNLLIIFEIKFYIHILLNFATYGIFLFLRSQPVSADASGKSNAGFYYSYDKLFIIKTLTSEEVERMHSFLKHYHPVRN